MRHVSTATLESAAGYALFDKQSRLVTASPAFFSQDCAAAEGLEGEPMLNVVSRVADDLQDIEAPPSKPARLSARSLMRRWADPEGAPLEVRTKSGAWKQLTCHRRPDGGTTLLSVDVTAAMQARSDFTEDQEIFRCITESHPLPVWVADEKTGEILYESLEASKLLGRAWDEDKPQFIGDHYVEPQDREDVKRLLRDQGRLHDYVVRFKKADGTRIWISANVRPGEFKGRSVLISGIVDVTARKEREDQIRFMLEGHPLPVAMNEVESGRLIMESPAYARMFGRTPNGGDEIYISDNYVYPEDREKLIAKLRSSSRVDDYEVQWKRADGSRFWVKINLRLVEFDGREVILGGVLDVTDQKRRESELSHARELLADAIESVSEGFALYDDDGCLVLCNSAYARMNEAAADILKPGMPWSELLSVSAKRGMYRVPAGQRADWVKQWTQRAAEAPNELEEEYADGRWNRISTHPTKLGGFVVTRSDITERKALESARREADEIVRQVVDACPAALEMRKISDGRFLYRSPAAIELLGKRKDLESTYVYAQDQIDLHRHLAVHRETLDRRMQLRNAAGDAFWASVSARYIDFRGELVVVSTISDLTARVNAEQEVKRANELLSDAIESLAEGFALFDSERRLVMCNSRYFGMNKPVQDRLKPGNKWDDILRSGFRRGQYADTRGDEDSWIKERIRDVQGRNKAYEFRQQDGRWYSALSSPTREGGFVITRMDITERIKMEQAQREADSLVRQVLEASPVMILMNELESGEIIYRSPATKALFGEPESVLSFYANTGDRDVYLDRLRREGRVDNFKYLARRPSGETFWASVSGRLIEFRGRPVIVSHTRDLTEQLAMEAELERQSEIVHQSEKLSALGGLLAGVAHELNNPLSVVVGQTLLLKETSRDATVLSRAEKIGSAADRCARIVRTFLAMARQQPARSENIDVNAAIESAMEVTGYAIRSSDIDVSLRLGKDLPSVWGDPDQLGQVFSNLLINAQQALTDFDGRRKIKVTTRYDRKKDFVVVKIADSGPGVPHDIRSRIFEPFFTTKEPGGGTGIGLAFCHRVVEAHGGVIRVESTPGEGASFFIRLPASGRAKARAVAED
ncbi:MAG TPA: PAS-domain containing protein, partial [Kiloniellaceae bacterium]|nr:PAS-domain containing protein [Kiloniellaceae bacterium]